MARRVNVDIGGTQIPALLLRQGRENSRVIIEDDGRGVLVPTACVAEIPSIDIPRTPLHELYYGASHARGVSAFDFIRKQCGAEPHAFLSERFRESVAQCRHYLNLEPFYEPDSRSDNYKNRHNYAHLLVCMLKHSRTVVKGFDCSYVAREISCLRTTNAHGVADGIDDPRMCSMDMLLRHNETNLPVITEVKARTDKGPAYALIQLLKYASEMVSPHQFERLRRFVPRFANLDVDHPLVEIQAIFEEQDDRMEEEWRWTEDAARRMMEGGLPRVRRIVFRQATIIMEEDAVHFTDLFEVSPKEQV